MSVDVHLIVVAKRGDNITGFLGINEYLGVGYIKSYLRNMGIQSRIHFVFSDALEDTVQLFTHPPKVIGLSVYTDTAEDVLRAAEILKTHYPEVHINIGGPNTVCYAEEILKDSLFVDSVITSEGEITFYELVTRVFGKETLEGCLGITYKKENGDIVRNGARSLIRDLNELPYPDRDIYEMKHQEYFYIVGSRGCMGGCSFCGETAVKRIVKPPYVRNRSADNIVDEMEFLINKYNLNSFRFTDATFEDPGEEGKKKAEGVFDEIIRRNLKVSLHIFSRAELVTEESREYLRKGSRAGLECVYVGVESGNEQDMRVYNKRARMEDNYRAIRIIREEGIHAAIGFINFNPYSTHDTLIQNADYLYQSGLGHVFYLYQTRLELLAQSSIKKKMITDGLVNPGANYATYFYDYQFLDPRIGELFDVIKNATVKTPTYYMDTILGMHRVWVNNNVAEDARDKFDPLFNRIEKITERDNELNYLVFKNCVEMNRDGASKKDLQEYCKSQDLEAHYDEFMDIYINVNVRVSKQRFKILLTA